MSRFRLLALVLAACSLLLAVPAALASPAGQTADAAGLQKAIVALNDDAPDDFLARLGNLGVVRGIELPTINAVAVTAPAPVVEGLASLPYVKAVEPQRELELHLYVSVEQINGRGLAEPGTYERDGDTFERPGVTGEGVTVGVIDSGIFAAHPGLSGRVVQGLNFEFSELQQSGGIPAEAWDAYAEATGPSALQDEVGHGTHVAGTIGGTGAGAQTHEDLSGVAPGVEFVSLKIASAANGVIEDVGFEENVLAAIDYLIRHPDLGVRLTNNSWGLLPREPSEGPIGEPTDFDAAKAMVREATEAGITMVFSAGNDGPEPDTIGEDPGGADEAITVAAACKAQDGECEAPGITEFSSRGAADGTGPQVDVAAPGDRILAPVSPSILAPLSECESPSDEPFYYCLSGTSMAAPHVAGTVALMQQANPDLTPAQAEQCLIDTADDMLSAGFDIHSGYGMVDAEEAVVCVHQLTGPTPSGSDDGTTSGAPDISGDDQEDESSRSLPSTGGGLVLAGLLGVAAAAALRRRP